MSNDIKQGDSYATATEEKIAVDDDGDDDNQHPAASLRTTTTIQKKRSHQQQHTRSNSNNSNSSSNSSSVPTATATTTTKQLVYDSLPYVDASNDEYEQYALALVEQEMRTLKAPPLNALPPIQTRQAPFLLQATTASYGAEQQQEEESFETSTKRQKRSSTTEEQLTEPTRDEETEKRRSPAVASLKQAVHRARIAYETERLRHTSLQSQKDVATMAWKQWNERVLANLLDQLQTSLQSNTSSVQFINANRQKDQQATGKQLDQVTHQYHTLVEKQFQLKHAIADLQTSVESLKQRNPNDREYYCSIKIQNRTIHWQ